VGHYANRFSGRGLAQVDPSGAAVNASDDWRISGVVVPGATVAGPPPAVNSSNDNVGAATPMAPNCRGSRRVPARPLGRRRMPGAIRAPPQTTGIEQFEPARHELENVLEIAP